MPGREIPWDKMRQEYIFTSATIRSLATKYGCSKRAVDRRSVAEGWVELRRREMTDIGQVAHARIHGAAVEDEVRIYDATREAADRIAQAILSFHEQVLGFHAFGQNINTLSAHSTRFRQSFIADDQSHLSAFRIVKLEEMLDL